MQKWKMVRLGDIANYVNEKIDVNKIDKSYYITTENMLPNKEGIEKANCLPSDCNVTKFKENDVLVSNIRPYFKKIWYSNKTSGCSNDVIVFRSKDINDCDSKYLYYILAQDKFFDFMMASANGTKMPRGNKQIIPNFQIPLPPLKTQKRIADILSCYDDLIENCKKQIKLLEEAASRLYKQWFVDFKFPGYENATFINGIPEGWEIGKICDRINLLSGFAFKSSTFSENGVYKIVTIKNVQDGQFEGNNVNKTDIIPQNLPEYCKLKDGDILLSLTGNVGRVCLTFGDKYLLNQRVAKLKSEITAFTYCLFRSKDCFDSMNNLANGSAQQNLSPIKTGFLEVIYPSKLIIEKFETLVCPMLKKIINLNKEIISATQARDRLLPRLMSGELI